LKARRRNFKEIAAQERVVLMIESHGFCPRQHSASGEDAVSFYGNKW
jgi:hypothetical protein